MNKLYGLYRGVLLALPVLGLLAGCGGMTSVPAPPAPATAHIYWTDAGTNTIQRARLDGTHVENLLPHGLDRTVRHRGCRGRRQDVLDRLGGGHSARQPGRFRSRDAGAHRPPERHRRGCRRRQDVLDRLRREHGSGAPTWTARRSRTWSSPTLDNPYGIALDVAGGKVYWTDAGTEKIQRADLDGSHVEDLVTVGVDRVRVAWRSTLTDGKMYWTDRAHLGTIQRANLDGSEVEEVVTPATPGVPSCPPRWPGAGCWRRQDVLDRAQTLDTNPTGQPGWLRHRGCHGRRGSTL